jgi:hypothetical protein
MKKRCPLTIAVVTEFCRFVSRAHLIEHDSKSPHVDFWTDKSVFGGNFWRNIASSAASLCHHGFSIILTSHHVREAKVAKFYNRIFASLDFLFVRPMQQYILYLHVAVDNPLRVDMVQTSQDVYAVRLQLFLIHYRTQSLLRLSKS